ncbi:CoA-binding protein, partial [Candidatus Pacearchaeota archaeon]|nr:CoA-binding protein [Candidatus Pacearchaeota archaeon]
GRLDDDNPRVVIDYLKRDHNVFLVNRRIAGSDFLGIKVYESIPEIDSEIDSAIVYMNPEIIRGSGVLNDLSGIGRVILPPGADSDLELNDSLRDLGHEVLLECPRVRLSLEYRDRK